MVTLGAGWGPDLWVDISEQELFPGSCPLSHPREVMLKFLVPWSRTPSILDTTRPAQEGLGNVRA